MSDLNELSLPDQIRAHRRALIDANTRSQAVDWMAEADNLLGKAEATIRERDELRDKFDRESA